MQMEARVGVVEGAQRSLNTVHGGVVDGGPRQLAKQQQQQHQQQTLNQQHSQIGTISHLLAGGIAGAVSKTCTAPLARLTILFQVSRIIQQGWMMSVTQYVVDYLVRKSPMFLQVNAWCWSLVMLLAETSWFRGCPKRDKPTGYVLGYIVAYWHVLEYIRPDVSSFHPTPDEIAYLGRDHLKVQGMHSDVATLSKPCIWREASRVLSEEGFRAFWKGNLVTIAHRLPYSSISFYAYERYKNLLQTIPGLESHRDNMGADVCVRLVGGGLSGITAASVTYPLDLVRTRLAAQTNVVYYRGISHTLRTICRDEGIFGLYKGLGATLLGVGPSLAISFSVYETLISSWRARRPHDSTILASLACGSLSGIASSTATFPLDLVRRRMQLEGAGGRAPVYKTGLFGTFGHIMRTEGLHGLYRGILPEYYKVVPSVGIVFMTFETIKMLLSDTPSND